MADCYQLAAGQIMYHAMITLRMLNPGRYNGFLGRSALTTGQLLALNGAIGDGLHNVPDIMVAEMAEDDRGSALGRELAVFMSTIGEMDLPDNMPRSWESLIERMQDVLRHVR